MWKRAWSDWSAWRCLTLPKVHKINPNNNGQSWLWISKLKLQSLKLCLFVSQDLEKNQWKHLGKNYLVFMSDVQPQWRCFNMLFFFWGTVKINSYGFSFTLSSSLYLLFLWVIWEGCKDGDTHIGADFYIPYKFGLLQLNKKRTLMSKSEKGNRMKP